MELRPIRLAASWHEKVWGSTDLSPLFGSQDRKIGEIWHTRPDGKALPILVKFLFTSEKLSVQVHPDDDYAARYENSCGKTEMWYVLRADPGASVAVGLTEPLTREGLRQAARSGEIERYLNWIRLRPGDAVFCPAGTIHAIGPGLALCEIQQHCDITYRLYDYGRPRDLHLERGIEVARFDPKAGILRRPSGGLLVSCAHFAVETLSLGAPAEYVPDPKRFQILIFLAGKGELAGAGYQPGDVYLLPEGLGPVWWHPSEPTRALRTWVPAAA